MADSLLKNGELLLYGVVGEGLFASEFFTALGVVDALAEHGRAKDITVRIDSGGGIAHEGVAIFNALRAHRGKVTVIVDGACASAASVIAMAGEEVVMRTGSFMMIHDPAGITIGNKADHEKTVEALETLSSSIADIYAEKTDRPVEEIRAEMADELWMTPREAVAKGYADRVERGRAKAPTAFDYRIYANAPARLVALAEDRGWTMTADAEEAGLTAANGQRKDSDMTDAETKAAADKRAAEITAACELAGAPDKAAAFIADATKTAGDVVQALKADADKAKADKAAAEAAEAAKKGTETPEQITARAVEAERKRASDIQAACLLANKPDKAVAFIAEGKSLSDVLAALKAEHKPGTEISARNSGNAVPENVTAAWGGIVDKVNSRIAPQAA